MNCLNCKKLTARKSYKYCSNKCQKDFEYQGFISSWKNNSTQNINTVTALNISHHIRRYLFEKYNSVCVLCGWSQMHPATGAIPLEVDHIDGNASNNLESNLRIVCPNCHSLTVNFRNLNKGKGRVGRVKKLL